MSLDCIAHTSFLINVVDASVSNGDAAFNTFNTSLEARSHRLVVFVFHTSL